ncbi:hypothetical protein AXF42_Ash017526 [Apostasia shenzhenica]|uniref:Uncharacterized protein n=1 Tax=Apostasia shenzhenica TaxID=1088818 RepID=A0A2I0A365_9ASPA|nr:hypothetical protein AXF42_Ash017526 [Apostasia shenzhenica]
MHSGEARLHQRHGRVGLQLQQQLEATVIDRHCGLSGEYSLLPVLLSMKGYSCIFLYACFRRGLKPSVISSMLGRNNRKLDKKRQDSMDCTTLSVARSHLFYINLHV